MSGIKNNWQSLKQPGEKSGCVLCVVDNINADYQGILYEAQRIALEKALPLAVVHCIDRPDSEVIPEFEKLKTAEKYHQEMGMPLMVLVGELEKRLRAVEYHLKPTAVVSRPGRMSGKLKVHPYSWPGRIITIDELIESGFNCDL